MDRNGVILYQDENALMVGYDDGDYDLIKLGAPLMAMDGAHTYKIHIPKENNELNETIYLKRFVIFKGKNVKIYSWLAFSQRLKRWIMEEWKRIVE
jgi:hypothetical protein